MSNPIEIKLDVPYRSQQGNRARLDCGAAVLAMLAATSVDEVLAAIRQPLHKALDFQAMYRALRHYGLPYMYRDDLSFEALRQWMAEGYPVIALANYGLLPASVKTDQNFDGAHYFLVVGASLRGVYVHDANRRPGDDSGQYLYIDADLFERMLANPAGDNAKWHALPNQGIVIRRQYGFVAQEMPKDAEAVEDRTGIDWRGRALKAENMLARIRDLLDN